MTVGIAVSTFGDLNEWEERATRAVNSARNQTHEDVAVYWHHQDGTDHSLGQVRNAAAKNLDFCDRLIFLDGDDELDEHYVEEMLKVSADIIQPATLGIVGDRVDPEAVLIPKKKLIDQNYIVIGAMLNPELFWKVNGFGDEPIFEDWATWLRMYNAGGTIASCPQAIYKIHVNENGRNSNTKLQTLWFNKIRTQNFDAFQKRGWT